MSGRIRESRTRGYRSRPAILLPLLAALPLLVGWSFLDPFHRAVEKGNAAAAESDDAKALELYDEAAVLEPSSPIPDFNRGLVLSRGDDPEAARDAFHGAAATEDDAVAADALYNLGNHHFDAQEFDPAIEAYLKSLDLDPSDADARRNLELAVQRLQQQQQQQQQQQEQQQQEQDEPGDEEPPPPEPDSSQGDQDEPPPEESPSDSEPQEEPQSAPEDRLSREDAERLLNAIQTEELKVLEQLQENDDEEQGGVAHDW